MNWSKVNVLNFLFFQEAWDQGAEEETVEEEAATEAAASGTGRMGWEGGEEEGDSVNVDWEGGLEEGWGELEEVARDREVEEEEEVGRDRELEEVGKDREVEEEEEVGRDRELEEVGKDIA